MHTNLRGCKEWEEAGLPMTTTSNEACKLYDAALSQYVGWYELEELAGLETTVEAMINTEPTFVMGHVVNVGLDLLSTGKSLLANPQLSDNLSLLNSLCKQQKITSREHMHVQALRHFADGHFLRAAELWETILIDHPSDMLAIKFAHDTYFYTGEQMQVRDSIARVLPYWNPTMPHYGYLHGMHAFGLVETNLFRQAELAAKKGLQFNAYDGWSTHALAHVYEMEGRTDEGILFLLNTEKKWERCGLLACHNYWHWAIYHMEDGNYKTAMELYEDRIQQYLKDKSILNIVDCASLLFRLKIADWPVRSELWRDVYNVVEPHLEDHITTFNDIHFLMTCLGADEMASAANLQETYINMELDEESNIARTRPLHEEIFKAIACFVAQDYDNVIEILHPIRYDLRAIGGSNAQRDLFNIMLITACLKSGTSNHIELGRRLMYEREAVKERSPLTRRLMAKVLSAH